MQVLDIIQPRHNKEQLDEVVFGGLGVAALTGVTILGKFLLTAIAASIGIAAIEGAVGSVKNWLDEMEIKKYKPTGKHIPDQTQITKGKQRFVYNAKEGKWGVQERSNRGMIQGKWKYQMIGGKDGGPMIPKTVNITAEDLKEALKKKRLTFGSKVAVLRTMDAQFIEKQVASGKLPADVKTSFTKSGNLLSDLINKEERLAAGKDKGILNKIKKGAKMIFSPRLFQMINIFMPVALVINCVRLKAWYEKKLNWGKGDSSDDNPFDTGDSGGAVGWPSPSGDPNKFYDIGDYDQDMRNLRTTTVNAAVAWMSMVGVNVIASGIFWIYAQRKGSLIDRAKKKGIVGSTLSFINPLRWAKFGLKWGSRGIAAGLVYSAFDRKFAEMMANAMVDYLFAYDPFTSKYSTAEDITEHLIKALGGSGYEQAMSQIGLGTSAGDDVVKAKDDAKDNPFDDSNPFDSNNFDSLTKDDPFWKQN